MSSTSESVRNDENAQPVRLTSELRIDAPHFVGMSPEFALGPASTQVVSTTQVMSAPQVVSAPQAANATPELSAIDPPAIPLAGKRERLQRHANELGAKLEHRCRDLDQRESQLNTRCAEFEQELRSARLWISEKQVELREREEQLETEVRAIAQVTTHQVESHEEASSRNGLDHPDLVERDPDHHDLDQRELSRRCEELKRVESRLRDARVQLEACRAQLIEKRSEFDDQVAEQRKLLENYQTDVEAELAARRQKLERQALANEQIRVILERCREEVEQKHRETLQLRLATEELWVRMSDGTPSTVMLQSLSKIRSRLADEYRTVESRIAKG